MEQKSMGFEEILFVMAQKSSAMDENFISLAHPCFDVAAICFVMAPRSYVDAPNRFAIEVLFFVISPEGIAGASEERASGQDVLAMAHGNPATAEAISIPEPADRAGGKADREGRLHDLRHLEVLTSGTSRKGGRLRRCA